MELTWLAEVTSRYRVFGIAKPEHFVQAQIYMRKMGIASCLYFAVMQDT